MVWKIYKNSPSYCLLLTLRNSVRKSVYVQCSGTLNSWLPCTCHLTSAAHHECSSLAALKLTQFSYATALLHTLHWLPVTAQISQVSGPCLCYSSNGIQSYIQDKVKSYTTALHCTLLLSVGLVQTQKVLVCLQQGVSNECFAEAMAPRVSLIDRIHCSIHYIFIYIFF